MPLPLSHLPLDESIIFPCNEQFDGRGRMRKTIDKLDSKMNCNGISERYKQSSADYSIELMNMIGALTNMGIYLQAKV